MQEERYQDVIRLLERLLSQRRRIPPEEVPRAQRRLVAAYVQQALQLKPLDGNRRNAQQAVRLLEKAATIDPGQPAPLYWCGVIYRWFGLWEKALDYFRRALDVDPGHLASRLELGWALLRQGDLQQARELVANQPAGSADGLTRWHWQRLTAATLLAEGRTLEAFTAYPGTPPEGPAAFQWMEEFLHLAEAAGSRDPAAVLRRLEAARDAVAALADAAEPAQDSPDPRRRWESLTKHLQALAAAERGELDTAIACWRQASAANSQDARRNQYLIRALTQRGARDWKAGRLDEAIASWAEARQRGGQDPDLLRRLALGYEQLQLWLEANQCWEDYLRLYQDSEPPTPRGAVLLAMAANAARAGRRDEAQKLLGRAARSITDRPDLLTWAGLLYMMLGNGQKAVAVLTKALELAPGNETAVQGLLHASRLDDVNRVEIITGLRDAIGNLSRDGWAYRYWREQALTLGRRLWESGAEDEAMELFASLLLADPGDIDAWVWAGTVHARRGNYNAAEDCFAEAIRLDPKRSRTYLDLGARFLAAGDRERAIANFEQAVRAAPGPHTHVLIGELCAEIGVPDLAEHHFRASLSGGRGVEPLLVRAILGLVRAGYEDRVRPFLEEAYKQVPESIQVRLLLAVQHMRHEQWVAADDTLRQAEEMARQRPAQDLLAHAAYFRRALILLRTIGHIDQEQFRERVKTLLGEWLQASSGGLQEPAGPAEEPVEALLARLPAPVSWEPAPGETSSLSDAFAPLAPAEAGDPGLFLRTVLPPIPVLPPAA
ncbi:MAG TPA: tetratricopeptide repeat protein [Limnochordales bacterium]